MVFFFFAQSRKRKSPKWAPLLFFFFRHVRVVDVRIYVLLGEGDNHLGLLEAAVAEGLFSDDDEDENFVVGVRIDPWEETGKFALFSNVLRVPMYVHGRSLQFCCSCWRLPER